MNKLLIQELKQIKPYCQGDKDDIKQYNKFIKELEGLNGDDVIKKLTNDQLQQILDYSTQRNYFKESQYSEVATKILNRIIPSLKYELPIDYSGFDAFIKYITMEEVTFDVTEQLTLIQNILLQRMCYNYQSVFTYLIQFILRKYTKLTINQKIQVENCIYELLNVVFKTPSVEQSTKEAIINYCYRISSTTQENVDLQFVIIKFISQLLDLQKEQISIIRNNIYVLPLLDCFKFWTGSNQIKDCSKFFTTQLDKKRKQSTNEKESSENIIQMVQQFSTIFQGETRTFVQLVVLYQLLCNYVNTYRQAGEYTKHINMSKDTLSAFMSYTYSVLKQLLLQSNLKCQYILSLLIYQLLKKQNELIQLCKIDIINIDITMDILIYYEKYFNNLNIQNTPGFELILNQPEQLVQENFMQYDNIEYSKKISLLQQYFMMQQENQLIYNFNYMYRGYIELLQQSKLIVEEQERNIIQIIDNNQLFAASDDKISQLQIQQFIQYSQLLKNVQTIALKCICANIPQYIIIQMVESIFTLVYIAEKQEHNVVMLQIFTNKRQVNKYKKQQLYVVSPTLQQLLSIPLDYIESCGINDNLMQNQNNEMLSSLSVILCTLLKSQSKLYTLPKQSQLQKLIQYAVTLYYINPCCQKTIEDFLYSKTFKDQKLFLKAIFQQLHQLSQNDEHFVINKLVLLLLSLRNQLTFDQQQSQAETDSKVLLNHSIDISIMHKINQFQLLLIEFGKEFNKCLSRCFLKLIQSNKPVDNKQEALHVIADIQIAVIVCANVYELSKLKLIDYTQIKILQFNQSELYNQYLQQLQLIIKYYAIKDKFNKEKSQSNHIAENFNQQLNDVYSSDSCFLFRYFCVHEPDYNKQDISRILDQKSFFLDVLDYIVENFAKIITFVQQNNYLINENIEGSMTCQILYLLGAFDLNNEVFKEAGSQENKQKIEHIINSIVDILVNYLQWYKQTIPSVLLYAIQQILIFIVGRDLNHKSTKMNPSFPLINATNMLSCIFQHQKDIQLLCDFLCDLGAQDIAFCVHVMFPKAMECGDLAIKQKIKIVKTSISSACEYCGDNELIMNIKDTLKLILEKQQSRMLVVSIFNAISDNKLESQTNSILSTINQYNLYMFQFDYNLIQLNDELIQFIDRYGKLILEKQNQQLAKIYLNVLLNYSEYYIGQISTLDLTRSDIYDQIKQIEMQIFTQAIKIALLCSNSDQDRFFSKIPEQFGHIYQKFDIFRTILLDVIYSNDYTALELSLPSFGSILFNNFNNHDITKVSAQVATLLSPGRNIQQLSMESLQFCLILLASLVQYYQNEGANTKDEIQCYLMTVQQVFNLQLFSMNEQQDIKEQNNVNSAIFFCTFFQSMYKQKEWILGTLGISIENILQLAQKMLEIILMLEDEMKQVEIKSIISLTDIFGNQLLQSKRSSVQINIYKQIFRNMLQSFFNFLGQDVQIYATKLYNFCIQKQNIRINEQKSDSEAFLVLNEMMDEYKINIQSEIEL